MIEVDVRRILSFIAVKFMAMVAVMVDNTQALIPLPKPSDNTLITRPSPFSF